MMQSMPILEYRSDLYTSNKGTITLLLVRSLTSNELLSYLLLYIKPIIINPLLSSKSTGT